MTQEWLAEGMAALRAAVESACAPWLECKENATAMLLGAVMPEMVVALATGVCAERAVLVSGEGQSVSLAAQRALQPVGVAFIHAAWDLQGHAQTPPVDQRPCCERCGRRMKLVAAHRTRHLMGRFGPYDLSRPYYSCERCPGGVAPADAAWGLGAGLLDPDLGELVASDGVRNAYEEAAANLSRHLQIVVDDNTVKRATEAAGRVAMEQRDRRAAAGACPPAEDPGSDVGLLELDGGRVDAGGEWRESRVAAAGALGPDAEVDAETGRVRLRTGPLHYAADITTAEAFFAQHVRQLAEDAGLFHPRIRSVVLLSDGAEWIEKGWATLGLPPCVEVFDILDVRHLEQHVWTAARACWGDHTARTKTWATKQIDSIRAVGPAPVLATLSRIRPQNDQGRDEMRKLRNYIERNAHRLRYPDFIARRLPIGSGAIEGAVRTVNNARLKQSGMHWSVAGARAVLTLRAIALSPPRCWKRFWDTRPQLARRPAPESPDAEALAA